jgi:hypothetical protein
LRGRSLNSLSHFWGSLQFGERGDCGGKRHYGGAEGTGSGIVAAAGACGYPPDLSPCVSGRQ